MVKTAKKSSRASNKKGKVNSRTRSRSGKVNSQKRKPTITKQSSKATGKSRGNKRSGSSKVIIRRTSGRREKFETEKMAQTVSRSGTPFLLARDVAKTVSEKLMSRENNITTTDAQEREGREITSSTPTTIEVDAGEVRNMVAEELKERNRPDIASSYLGERPENAQQGGHEVMNKNQQPLHDANAAIQSKLMFDSSTQMARSTKSSSQLKH